MQKILFVTEASSLSMEALQFAGYIAKNNNAVLKAIFPEDIAYKSEPEVKAVFGSLYVEEITANAVRTPEKKRSIEEAINKFSKFCFEHDISCTSHWTAQDPVHTTVSESRYADLLVLDPTTSFAGSAEEVPTKFCREVLHKAECPVLVAPEVCSEINEIVLCYDNSLSSVHAIRQFTYLFPKFANKNVTLFHVEHVGEDSKEYLAGIKEWLDVHYPGISVQSRYGRAASELFKNYYGTSGKLLVMGAYGRSEILSFFKQSAANMVIKAIDTPIFIAHI